MLFDKEFQSNEEKWFSYYISELKNAGYIKEAVYQPEPFELSPDLFAHVFERGKKENKFVEIKLTREAVYTADWLIEWDRIALGVVAWHCGGVYDKGFFPYRKAHKDKFIPFFAFTLDNKLVSYVDVKGTFSGAHGLSKFSLQQKWLLNVYEIFVQKIVVSLDEKGIFARTFTPRQVIIDEVYKKDSKFGKKGQSKLKYEPLLFEKWKK